MTRVHVLGAGTPTPTPERFGSAYVIDTGNDLAMFDCGPAATHELVKSGLFPTEIDHLFFTHHHFDHDADYPCFLLCRWDQSMGKEEMLTVRAGSTPVLCADSLATPRQRNWPRDRQGAQSGRQSATVGG